MDPQLGHGDRIGVRVRAAFKPLLKPLLWRVLLFRLRHSNRLAGLVLLYHSVGDRDGNPRLELVPPISRSRFGRQLAHLRRHYRLVELPDLLTAIAARNRGERFPVALTFDDDHGHHVTHALPELRDADASATFFLCGAFLKGPPRDYWWQRLQRAVDGGVDVAPLVGCGTIHDQGRAMEALAPARRDAVADELLQLAGAPPARELLTTEDARRLPSIGFHTVRHDRLPELDDELLSRALDDGRAGLAEMAGCPVDAIAYPHGRFDARVLAAARERGFKIGLTCEPVAVTPSTDPLALGRYEPPISGRTGDFAFSLARILQMSRSQ